MWTVSQLNYFINILIKLTTIKDLSIPQIGEMKMVIFSLLFSTFDLYLNFPKFKAITELSIILILSCICIYSL